MIGSNTSLRAAGSNLPQAPVQKAQPRPAPLQAGSGYVGQSTVRPPQFISDSTTESAANNMMAQGWQAADQRYCMKKLDRAGIWRGKGQQFIAGQEGAQAMSTAAAQTAEMRAKDASTNSKMQSDYEKSREMEAQNNAMVQHQVSQSDWSQDFARKQAQAQIQMASQQARMNYMIALMRN